MTKKPPPRLEDVNPEQLVMVGGAVDRAKVGLRLFVGLVGIFQRRLQHWSLRDAECHGDPRLTRERR